MRFLMVLVLLFGYSYSNKCIIRVKSDDSKYNGTWQESLYIDYDFRDEAGNYVSYYCLNEAKQGLLIEDLNDVTTDYKCFELMIESKTMRSTQNKAQVICKNSGE